MAAIGQRYKLIRTASPDAEVLRVEVYDLMNDPGEERPLDAEHVDPDALRALREALDAAERGLRRAAVWPQYGGGPHLHLAKAVAQYKLAKMGQRDIGPAIETLRQGLQQHKFIPLRPRHKHVPMSRRELEVQLAQWLVEQDNENEAEHILSDAVELRIRHLGKDHPSVALAIAPVGSRRSPARLQAAMTCATTTPKR